MAEIHTLVPEPDPAPLTIVLDDLTIGDLEDFEDITGKPLDEAMALGPNGQPKVSPKVMKALVFLTLRKTDPSFTLEDARNVKVSALAPVQQTDPTDAAGSSS